MYSKNVTTNSGLPEKRLRSSGFCVAIPDRARVEMADAHHHATTHHERRRGEAELLATEQRRDHDVAPGLELPVDLHDDPVAQPVAQEGLLRLGQARAPTARPRA